MYIKDLFKSDKPVVSLEIFPPKKDSPVSTVYNMLAALADIKPDYISVTYGAGGSTKDRTVEIASLIKNKYGIEALAHLTCISSTKDEVDTVLGQLKKENIDNILVLRGDLPNDPDFVFPNPLQYKHASDLAAHVKNSEFDFCLAGACYPEKHPDSGNIDQDIDNLKYKVSMGVDFLITQLFFDDDLFYDFKDRLCKCNINVPIDVGVMPIINKRQVERVIKMCGAKIPRSLVRIIDKYEDHPQALLDAGIAFATSQIVELASYGIDGVHLYTMNNPEVAKKIYGNVQSILKD